LDEADSMTNDAQSALRRIIEDYTEQTRFCIICNYASKIIDPIASRCAQFRFGSLSKESQLQRLKFIANEEKIAIPDNILNLLQIISDGDLRRSINLLQSISQLDSDLINEDIVMDICGIIPNDIIQNLVSDCKRKNVDGIIESVKNFIACGYDLKILINQLSNFFAEDNISEDKKFKIFEILLDKDISLCQRSSNEILAYDLVCQISKVLRE
jgi:replication factor C subunit 2/4